MPSGIKQVRRRVFREACNPHGALTPISRIAYRSGILLGTMNSRGARCPLEIMPVEHMSNHDIEDSRTEIEVYVDGLFKRAFQSSMLDFLFTILRVEGIHTPGWDPFEEINRAIDDINWLLKITKEQRSSDSSLRVGLLLYSHLIEMSAAHNVCVIRRNRPENSEQIGR